MHYKLPEISLRLKKVYNIATNISLIVVKFVPERYNFQEMCHKAADTSLFVFDSVPHWYDSRSVWQLFPKNLLH